MVVDNYAINRQNPVHDLTKLFACSTFVPSEDFELLFSRILFQFSKLNMISWRRCINSFFHVVEVKLSWYLFYRSHIEKLCRLRTNLQCFPLLTSLFHDLLVRYHQDVPKEPQWRCP